MANMTLTKTPMPEQDPKVRARNFEEVALGYTAEQAMEEAGRCLGCKKPKCVEGCPVNVRIPEFIAKVAEGDFQAAYEIVTSTNALPALSGRVCPQESQCESKCVRGVKGEPVAIGRLERFVADWYREHVNAMPEKAPSNGVKVGPCQEGLRRYRIRGAAHRRWRAGIWHSGIPSAQGHCGQRGQKAGGPGRGGHDQHGHRPGPVHRRAV